VNDDRRAYQRLTLREPLDGWFGDFAVRLVDVSASGAQLEHEDEIPAGAHGRLRFWWRGEELEILARTARTILENRTGVEFVEESDALNAQIAASAAELLRASEANARGDRAANVIGDETLTAASRTLSSRYVCWTLTEDGWTGKLSLDCSQPENGFTVSASEPESDVEMLRRTYEGGDTESRRLTRMLAELSVAPGT
jgi:hypothetical protein